jgi:hypothetical protein
MKGGSILEYIPRKSNGTTSTSCCNKGTSAIAYTYDLCTTVVVQEVGGCLTKKKPS